MSLRKQRITQLRSSKLSLLWSVCFLMVGLPFVRYKNDTDNGDELCWTNTSYSCNMLSSEVIWNTVSISKQSYLEWLSAEQFHWKAYGVNPCYEVLELFINHNFKFCFAVFFCNMSAFMIYGFFSRMLPFFF